MRLPIPTPKDDLRSKITFDTFGDGTDAKGELFGFVCWPVTNLAPHMMSDNAVIFWAKPHRYALGEEVPGISVLDHCMNVGWVAQGVVETSPMGFKNLLPADDGRSATVLASVHDIGKITSGFQIKSPAWSFSDEFGDRSKSEAMQSIGDHALASQVFLQDQLMPVGGQPLRAVIGAHHGRPKRRNAKRPEHEACAAWNE
jgi:CRISPR-associated endonuclease Cas3-HD